MIRIKRLPRFMVQLACFASASALLWPVLSWKSAPGLVIQASPFIAICSAIGVRAIGAGTVAGLILAAVAVAHRRWFCRYACPTGFVLEWAAKVGFQKTGWWTRCPQLGKYAALLTLAGALVGYPLLLWMDPLAIFSSSFAVRTAGSITAGILSGLGFAALVLSSLTSGQVWCARICPLGGTQELLASVRSLARKRQVETFPVPGSPFPVLTENGEPGTGRVLSAAGIARRGFLIGVAGIGFSVVAEKAGAARGERAPLRPPGAVEEGRFTGLCLRCGNCVRACPSKIIHSDIGLAGIAGLLAPAIRYEKKYCLEDCRACTDVCPSGAIQKIGLEEKRRYIIGEALVDGSLCLVTLGRKDCDACVWSCPFDAIRIEWSEEQYVAYPSVKTDKCNGCGACEIACPTEDLKAIRVWKRKE